MKRPVAIAFALMMGFGIMPAACAPAVALAPAQVVETRGVGGEAEQLPQDAVIGAAPTGKPALPGKSQDDQTSLAAAGEAAFPFVPGPLVAQMIGEVDQNEVYSLTGYLSGELPLFINGKTYSLQTRNTYSEDIVTATQYVRDFLQTRGITAGYRDWSGEGEYGQSVVGVITGTWHPDEIVLVVAHLDDMPEAGRAPGADDNASGSVGALLTAARLAGHKFDRTVRFLFTTDEENEGLSAETYARASQAARENIVAVYNLDMIGWDYRHAGAVYLETRYTSNSGYSSDLAVANVFIQVVNAYDLNALDPYVDPCYDDGVDSRAFWDNGFPGITAIEDYDRHLSINPDSNHTAHDTLATLDMPFFTSFVKASVGAVAHMAIPIELDLPNKIYLPLVLKF